MESILFRSGIRFKEKDLKILNRKSIKIFIKFKDELRKLDVIIPELSELNTVLKLNTVLARFVYKYSSFAENYLLALIQNCEILNKTEFISILKKNKSRYVDQLKKAPIDNAKIFLRSKIKTCEKALSNIEKLRNLKFVEKCEIYNQMYHSNVFEIASVKPSLFSKIRTFRNKAVHSGFILEYFLQETSLKNLISLYLLIDKKYRKQFAKERKNIFKKYDKRKKFKLLSLKHL